MENQEYQDTEAIKVNQDPLDCQDLKEKRDLLVYPEKWE